MTGTHPDELDLLSYVEGDLGGAARDSVIQHVATCPDCGTRVRELESAREVLRAASPLEFPRDQAALELPPRPEERRVYVSPMRLATVLAPVAAVVALVIGLANLPSGGDDAGGGAGDAAMEAERDAAGGAAEEGAATDIATERPVAAVRGPAPEVAALLRREGFAARVASSNRVVVTDAAAAEVIRALQSRPGGRVEVIVP